MSGTSTQRFNHVAMTVDPDLLDAAGRSQILAFYGDVFGWTEMPSMTEDRKHLVLRAHSNEQFVFIAGGEAPMRAPHMDHFGLSVKSKADFDGLLARAEKWHAESAEVDLVPSKTEDFGVLRLHSFYVGYKLPMKVEVQCFEWAEGAGPGALPETG